MSSIVFALKNSANLLDLEAEEVIRALLSASRIPESAALRQLCLVKDPLILPSTMACCLNLSSPAMAEAFALVLEATILLESSEAPFLEALAPHRPFRQLLPVHRWAAT